TVREIDFKRHDPKVAAFDKAKSLGGNRYEASPTELRELRAGHAKDPDAHAGALHYDPMRNVTYYEADGDVGGRRQRLHIEAKLADRITSFTELAKTENAVIGNPVSIKDGLDIIARLNRGDATALAKLGIGGTGALPGGYVEFGLGLFDGQVMV